MSFVHVDNTKNRPTTRDSRAEDLTGPCFNRSLMKNVSQAPNTPVKINMR